MCVRIVLREREIFQSFKFVCLSSGMKRKVHYINKIKKHKRRD